MVDKDEVALALNVNVKVPDEKECIYVSFSKSCVSEELPCVSKTAMKYIKQKVLKVLKLQGVACGNCEASRYILSDLSDCKGIYHRYRLSIGCQSSRRVFEIRIKQVSKSEDKLELKQEDG